MILSSKEIAKSCIMLHLGKRNLERNDLLSCGVNLYYSLFHACLSVLVLTFKELDIEKCVSEFDYRSRLAPYYIPMSHKNVVNAIRKFDKNLSDELDDLKEIREYLSYGPNLFIKTDQKDNISNITIFTCRISEISEKIKRYSRRLDDRILGIMRIVESTVGKDNFYFISLYFGSVVKILCRDLHLEGRLEREVLNKFIEDASMRKLIMSLPIPKAREGL